MKSKGKKTVLTAADYRQWIVELKTRYRATQIKAAVVANIEKKLLSLDPTPAQLAKCYADAEAQIASSMSAAASNPTVKRLPKNGGVKEARRLARAKRKDGHI